jgi:hypothetical protein
MRVFERQLYEINPPDLEKVKDIVAKFYNIPKEFFDKIKVEYTKLPYLIEIRKVGNYVHLFIRKILGIYDVLKKKIYIDKNLPYNLKILTAIHEFVHAAQDYLGKFYRESREKMEKEAKKVANFLFRIFRKY